MYSLGFYRLWPRWTFLCPGLRHFGAFQHHTVGPHLGSSQTAGKSMTANDRGESRRRPFGSPSPRTLPHEPWEKNCLLVGVAEFKEWIAKRKYENNNEQHLNCLWIFILYTLFNLGGPRFASTGLAPSCRRSDAGGWTTQPLVALTRDD